MLAAIVQASTEGVSWFPQEHAALFNTIKGAAAILAVLLLVMHMNKVWMHEALTWGRRLRYLALLGFAGTVAGGSVEQVNQDAVVNYRNLGGAICIALTLLAVAVSIYETRTLHEET